MEGDARSCLERRNEANRARAMHRGRGASSRSPQRSRPARRAIIADSDPRKPREGTRPSGQAGRATWRRASPTKVEHAGQGVADRYRTPRPGAAAGGHPMTALRHALCAVPLLLVAGPAEAILLVLLGPGKGTPGYKRDHCRAIVQRQYSARRAWTCAATPATILGVNQPPPFEDVSYAAILEILSCTTSERSPVAARRLPGRGFRRASSRCPLPPRRPSRRACVRPPRAAPRPDA